MGSVSSEFLQQSAMESLKVTEDEGEVERESSPIKRVQVKDFGELIHAASGGGGGESFLLTLFSDSQFEAENIIDQKALLVKFESLM